MNRLRLLTAGESHGPEMSGILDGLPAGLRVVTKEVDRDLARRQHGYGSGRRMQIEKDVVEWTAGMRFGRTLGSPLAFTVANRDWVNWRERMSVEPIPDGRKPKADHPRAARPRGPRGRHQVRHRRHPERPGARVRAVDGAPCRGGCGGAGRCSPRAASRSGATATSWARSRRSRTPINPFLQIPQGWWKQDRRAPTPLRCPDPDGGGADAPGDRRGHRGGRHDRRLASWWSRRGCPSAWARSPSGIRGWTRPSLAGAVMGIQAVKGVEIGLGFGVGGARGTRGA